MVLCKDLRNSFSLSDAGSVTEQLKCYYLIVAAVSQPQALKTSPSCFIVAGESSVQKLLNFTESLIQGFKIVPICSSLEFGYT